MYRYLKFWNYLKEFKASIFSLFAIILVLSLLSIPLPWIQKEIIDEALPKSNLNLLYILLGGMAGIMAVNSIGSYMRNKVSIRLKQKVLTKVRMKLYTHLQKMSMHFLSKQQTGSLVSRILNDVNRVQSLTNDQIFDIIASTVQVVIAVLILIKLSVKLFLFCLCILPAVIVILFIYKKKVYQDNIKLQETQASLSGKIQENLSQMRLIQAEVLEKEKKSETYDFSRKYERVSITWGMRLITGNLLLQSFSSFPITVIIWGLGGYMIIKGQIKLGELLAFHQYVFMVVGSLTGLFSFIMSLQSGYAAFDRIYEILDNPADVKDNPDAIGIIKPIEKISFNNISLKYKDIEDADKTIKALNNIQLTLRKGDRVGIVGPSGSGKTSLINILMRFNLPDNGELLINDIDAEKLKIRDLRTRIAYVPQDDFFFYDTIKYNITLGKEYGKQQIEQAVKLAYADEFILELEKGYDTVIGEKGVTLSGGQRKRLALARAFLKNPDIYIFDEAFSALDSGAADIVHKAIKNIAGNKIMIIVAHNFSFLQLIDRILVLSNGEIIEDGSFDELISQQGLFHKLLQIQNVEEVYRQNV